MKLDEESFYYKQSITVRSVRNTIIISGDEKYTGSSSCPQCDFFPCKINQDYFTGGIENCKLWNKINPNTLSDVIDQRDWGEGNHLKSQKIKASNQLSEAWKKVKALMARKSYLDAIPLICSLLI